MSSTFNILSAMHTQLTPDSASRSALGRSASLATAGEPLAGTSAIVELGMQSAEALTYAAVLPRVQQLWTAGTSGDVVSKQIAINFATTDASRRLLGLGAALLEGYKGEAGNYRQALLTFTGVSGSAQPSRRSRWLISICRWRQPIDSL